LTVEDPYNLFAHHQRYGQFRARRLRRADVARILAHVRSVDRLFLQDRCAGDPFVASKNSLVLARIPADLRTDAQLLGILVEQEDGHVRQVKIVPRDRQNSLQHLV
jgi:hypothetical protein